ncbi:MAG: response regulator [Nitrospira sp.]|nr:MAG: response regulator [Nitrospira sp.]
MHVKVCIVDDNEDILILLEAMLKTDGYEVVSCTNGRDALQLIREEQPDLILTDFMMPDLNGLELIEQARQYNPDLCFIVMTGFATIELATECIRSGATDFLAKPFTSEALNIAVERALKGVRLRREVHILQRELQPTLPSYGTMAEVETPNNQGNSATVIRSPSSQATQESSSLQDHSLMPIYPFIMGGLLHNALNTITSILFQLDQPNFTQEPNDAESDHKLNSAVRNIIPTARHLSVLLQVMQQLTRSFYAKDENYSIHSQVQAAISSFVEGNPSITYHCTVPTTLDHISMPGGVSTFIVGELLKNSTKACSDRQNAEIWLTIEVMERMNMLSFECQDTGRGFSEDMLAKIRAHELRPARDKQVGGYGLYLIQELTHRLGGDLLVSNKIGARIQVLLPLTVKKGEV